MLLIVVLGVIGLGVHGTSVLLLYRREAGTTALRWRLIEKIAVLSGFFLLLLAWVFVGFNALSGNRRFELLHAWSIPLLITGTLLSSAGLLSWTERRTKALIDLTQFSDGRSPATSCPARRA
jgi:hypothetical protein